MAGTFTTRVTIPQVQPEVGGVATYRAPLATAPDVSTGLKEGAQQIAQASSEFGKMLVEQGRHQQIIDSAGAEENIKDQFNQIRVDARQLPGNQQAQYVKDQTTAVGKQMLEDPANAHIRGYLGTRIPQLQGVVLDDARLYGAEQTMRDQKAQNDRLDQKVAANDVAGSYVVGPDGKVIDNPKGTAGPARQQVYGRYDAMFPQNPIMAGALKHDFDIKATEARAQYIARNPDAAHPDLLNNFIEQNRDVITPQMETELHNAQTAAVNEPMRQQEAGWTALRASSIQYQQDFIAKNGHPDMARLEKDAQWKRIQPEDYQRFSGQQYVEPTPKGTLDAFDTAIAGAKSEDDIDAIRFGIESSAANKTMNGRDVPALNVKLQEKLRHLRTEAGPADVTASGGLEDYYTPNANERLRLGGTGGLAEFESAKKKALTIYKSMTFGHPTDPEAYTKAAEAAKKAVPRPTVEGIYGELRNPGAAAKPAAPAPPKPAAVPKPLASYNDDQFRRIAAYVRAHPEALA
jgi:hypothetical protein